MNLIATGNESIGWDVLADSSETPNHAVTAYPNELMKRRTSSEKGSVPELHMSSEEAMIRENIVISDDRVVTHVAPNHEEVVASNPRNAVFHVAAVNSYIFPKPVAVTNPHGAEHLGIKLQILRSPSNHGAMTDFAIVANFDSREHLRVPVNDAVITDYGSGLYHGKTSDFHVDSNFS